MPKPNLIKQDADLESELIETALAGLHEWRSDLHYPESHSDMQGCIRAILRMYEVKRRPLPAPLRIMCRDCEGLGRFLRIEPSCRHETTCAKCNGKGWIAG